MCSPVHEAFCGSYSSIVELREAATHFERAAALCPAPAVKAEFAENAAWCRATAGAMYKSYSSDPPVPDLAKARPLICHPAPCPPPTSF